ncbi:hypothetical protein B0H10DRAFT_2217167 [Mycena sp. CBHHK59/15]|nr:hypothetical protein B0H10DRAFT_2217167 [Mycena sp. CBHHK59/15]
MEAGEDDTDTAPPPLVVRRADLLSLEIETYIDLSAAKLKERFAPDQGKPQPEVPEAPKKPAGQSSSKWTATDTEWDAAAWWSDIERAHAEPDDAESLPNDAEDKNIYFKDILKRFSLPSRPSDTERAHA